WRGIMARKSGISSIALATFAAGLLVLSPTAAQQSAATAQGLDTKDELAQNFAAEHEIGRRYHFDPNDLPPPKTGPIVADRSLVVPFNGQKLEVPPGFTAAPFVTGLVNPRRLLVLPNGDVLVAEQSAGYVTLLRDDEEGRLRHHGRAPEPSSGDRPENRRPLCRGRLVRQCRRRARTQGDDPALRCRRLESDDRRVRHAQPDRPRVPSADRRIVGGRA